MKITVINGSPRGKDSVSEIMLSAFLSGAGKEADIVKVMLAEKEIRHCKGCYSCWTGKEGCVNKDDFSRIIKDASGTDIIVFASPVYFGNVTGLFKNFIDRLTSTGSPHTEVRLGTPKFVMMSNCGYDSDGEFRLVSLWINDFVGKMKSTLLGEFYYPNGKQLKDPENEKAKAYLKMLADRGKILFA